MGMNGITAQADLARAIEEMVNRKDSSLPPSITSVVDQPTQDETSVPRLSHPSYDDEQTEITACISTARQQSENSQPGIDVASLRRVSIEKVDLKDLYTGYIDSDNGRRNSERHAIRLAVVVYSAKRSFRTATSNISLGGVKLRDKMPEQFKSGEIEILVIVENRESDQKDYFLMSGKSVTGDRVQFTSASLKAKTTLRILMDNLAVRKAA